MTIHKKLLDQNRLLMSKRSDESKKWFDDRIKKLSSGKTPKNLGNNLILFNHMPKEKNRSYYHDIFPILFPVNISKDEITGFNLHYVPHAHRAFLMDNLKDSVNKPMEVGGGFLRSSKPMKLFSPALRKYSIKDINSKVVQITPDEWKYALFLPSQAQ